MYTSMNQNFSESRPVNTLGLSMMKICLGMNRLIKLFKKAAFNIYTLRICMEHACIVSS